VPALCDGRDKAYRARRPCQRYHQVVCAL